MAIVTTVVLASAQYVGLQTICFLSNPYPFIHKRLLVSVLGLQFLNVKIVYKINTEGMLKDDFYLGLVSARLDS